MLSTWQACSVLDVPEGSGVAKHSILVAALVCLNHIVLLEAIAGVAEQQVFVAEVLVDGGHVAGDVVVVALRTSRDEIALLGEGDVRHLEWVGLRRLLWRVLAAGSAVEELAELLVLQVVLLHLVPTIVHLSALVASLAY